MSTKMLWLPETRFRVGPVKTLARGSRGLYVLLISPSVVTGSGRVEFALLLAQQEGAFCDDSIGHHED